MSNFREFRLNDRDKLLRTFNCDIRWVSLMRDKDFVKMFMQTVIKDASSKGSNVNFSGVIRPNQHPKTPKKGFANIYLIEDKQLKWCCCIVENRKKYSKNPIMIWYDPSDELSKCEPRFDKNRKNQIISEFEEMDVLDLKTPHRVQQFCFLKHPAADIFSSTWSVMFSSVYINNAFDLYTRIDFIRWQTQPLKQWLKCIITRFPAQWKSKLENDYNDVFNHCRRVSGDSHDAVVEPLLPIKGSGSHPCIYSILVHYLGIYPDIL